MNSQYDYMIGMSEDIARIHAAKTLDLKPRVMTKDEVVSLKHEEGRINLIVENGMVIQVYLG